MYQYPLEMKMFTSYYIQGMCVRETLSKYMLKHTFNNYEPVGTLEQFILKFHSSAPPCPLLRVPALCLH